MKKKFLTLVVGTALCALAVGGAAQWRSTASRCATVTLIPINDSTNSTTFTVKEPCGDNGNRDVITLKKDNNATAHVTSGTSVVVGYKNSSKKFTATARALNGTINCGDGNAVSSCSAVWNNK